MRHRITATLTFEFEVRESSYPGSETDEDRLLVDIEQYQDNPEYLVDMLGDARTTVVIDGELVPE